MLLDTTLCTIVRDEMINPAGGIIDFIDSTVPFVEQAVIVDTGSIDGTREVLEHLQLKYPNLAILDRQFDDFASSRNFALDNVKTKKVLILDADERLTKEDFLTLQNKQFEDILGYNFLFRNIYANDHVKFRWDSPGTHNPRYFINSKKVRYRNTFENYSELLYYCKERFFYNNRVISSGLVIKHFKPTLEASFEKNDKWYRKIVSKGLANNISPSLVKRYQEWNQPNPLRESYR